MVKPNDLLEAVKGLLRTRYPELPEEALYTNYAPSGFLRPSFLVETGPRTMVSAGRNTLEVEAVVIVTAFATVDKIRNSQIEVLEERTMDVQLLFAAGKLEIGRRGDDEYRALEVESVAADVGNDWGEVTVTLRYLDDRPLEREEYPLMGEADVNFRPHQ